MARSLFAAFLWIVSTSFAHAALELYITEGVNSARSIAIVPFKWQGAGKPPADVAKVVASDLQRSGKFSPLAPEKLPEQPSHYDEINFAKWSAAGVDALVTGTITPADGGGYLIRYQLIDMVRANAQGRAADELPILLNHQKTVTSEQVRPYAHRISDLIYQALMGEKGAFLTRIAYVVIDDKAKYRYQLRIADYDGFNERTVLNSSQPLMSPAWSPDGEQLAYVSFENGQAQVFIMNIYTGKRELISSFPRHNGSPQFSPDGNKLALVLSKSGSLHLYVLDLKTKNWTQITQGRSNNTEPFWDPSGNSLIFTSDRGGKPQIYRVDLKGDFAVNRLTWQGSQNLGGQLTPDGKHLIMVHQSDSGYNIAKQDLQLGTVEILTNTTLDESPSLAPNGSMVIYSSVYGNSNVLSLVSIDGRFKARLPVTQGRVRAPAWSPFQ
ncbi:MAG: Tol-Pal system beta propeller repeat protein TolB [Enterovibrio sp.]